MVIFSHISDCFRERVGVIQKNPDSCQQYSKYQSQFFVSDERGCLCHFDFLAEIENPERIKTRSKNSH